MRQILNNIAFTLWSIACVVGGVLLAVFIQKPQTIVNNSIKKVKGENNRVTNEPNTTIENVRKKRFRLFGRKRD